MQVIVAPIKPGDTGAQVSNLQDALLALYEKQVIHAAIAPAHPDASELGALIEAFKAERDAATFDGSTKQVVYLFQLQQFLKLADDRDLGSVEEKTAARLNDILQSFGAIDTRPVLTIKGNVIFQGARPDGTISVVAFDRDMRTRQKLGGAVVGADGSYVIEYTPDTWPQAEQGGPDILVEVCDRGDAVLATSETVFNAAHPVDIDVTVPGVLVRLSEYEDVLTAVQPLLIGQGPGGRDLRLDECTSDDQAFIVKETGQPQDLISALVLAAQAAYVPPQPRIPPIIPRPFPVALPTPSLPIVIAPVVQASAIPAEVYYCWFREGPSQSISNLMQRSNVDLVASLDRDVERNLIPAIDAGVRDGLPAALSAVRAHLALQTSGNPETASLGDALRLIPDADRLQLNKPDGPGVRLMMLIANADPKDPPSWEKRLEAVGDEALLRSAQRSLGLHSLTGGFVPWMRELQRGDAGAPNPTLVDLVANDTADWVKFAQKHGVPKDVVGASDDERFTRYGRQISARTQLMHPAPFVQKRIESDRIPVAPELKGLISKFLNINPAYRLHQTPYITFAASKDFNAGDFSAESITAITSELMRLERVAKIVPLLDHMEPLLRAEYGSARAIVKRRSRIAFVKEMRDAIGNEVDAGQIYDNAAGVAANTDALVLRHSPLFLGPNLPVIPTEDRSVAARAVRKSNGNDIVLPPSLQQLFGNQDYCECAHGASLYGAAAYLADLLQMLAKAPATNGKTPLQVLLERRPDLAEIDLTGDNTEITLQYIDLVLEILEQPDWEVGSGIRVLRGGTRQNPNNSFDAQLDQGFIPTTLASDLEDLGFRLSEHCTVGSASEIRNSAGALFKSWLIRDSLTGLKLRLIGAIYGAYRIQAYPQSSAATSKVYRPWSTQLSRVAAKTGTARFPWNLPFDPTRDEANAWLKWLGTTREEILIALAPGDPWKNIDAACEFLKIAPATRVVLTSPPDASHPDFGDWGFTNASVGAEGIVDSVAGMTGSLTAANMIKWDGAEERPDDSPDWHALLKNVSLLRSRAHLTHRELLDVLSTQFVLGGQSTLDVSGAECDSALMRLQAMDAALARRIHLFVRLWRLLGWSHREVDTAINAQTSHVTSAGSTIAFSPEFLLFIANIARLSSRTHVPVSICLDLFCSSNLDTAAGWNYDGAQPVRALSRYETWFDNSVLGRPRVAEFQLKSRNDLAPVAWPDSGLPKARISDHTSYIAAALGIPVSELITLLPTGTTVFPPMLVTSAVTSGPIDVGQLVHPDIEVLIGKCQSSAGSTLTVQHSDDGHKFTKVDKKHIKGCTNPWTINAASQPLTRFTYSGEKQFIRISIQPVAVIGAGQWINIRWLPSGGRLTDELALHNLTALCKYAILRRLVGRPMTDVLALLRITNLTPGANLATPDLVLDLLDARDALGTLNLSVVEADALLHGPDGPEFALLESQAGTLLSAARSAYLAIRNESTVAVDQRSVLLSKILTDFGWSSGRIAEVLSQAHLGLNWGDYVAPLDSLPAGAQLPASMHFDKKASLITASINVRPAELHSSIAPMLATTSGNLKTALISLDAEALRREDELASLQTVLREKVPHTFEVNWIIPKSLSIAIPAEWQGRFYYERSIGKLRFVGWMSPADRDALFLLGTSLNLSIALSGTFAAAVNVLYEQANAPGYTDHIESTDVLVGREGKPGISAESLLLDTIGLQDRCGLILDALLPDWRSMRLRAKLVEALAQSTGCTPEVTDALLSLGIVTDMSAVLLSASTAGSGTAASTDQSGFNWFATDSQLLASDPITATTRAAFPATFDAAAQLIFLARLVRKLGFDSTQVSWLRGTWSRIDFNHLPTTRIATVRADLWTSLIALSQLIALKNDQRIGPAVLVNVLMAAAGTVIDHRELAGIFGCSEADLRALASATGLNIAAPAWLRNPNQLRQLATCIQLCHELGIPATLLLSAASAQSASRTAAEAEGEVQALRQVALGSTPDGNWPDEEKKVLDQIRQRRRDATVDYLVHAHQVRDANDLYGHYLIDPQMGPCMETSRIVQAISSVQLFIQRCFMLLEPAVPPNSLDKTPWAWMKNYRVWEANRKVLLYPENWIEPELREDKTPFFGELVSALQQGDTSSDKAELAVQSFLEKLADFSRMQTVSICSDYDDNNHLKSTYIFARTVYEPRIYYFRKFQILEPTNPSNSIGVWGNWQELELDIEGEHHFSIVWKGRLLLFWAIFSQDSGVPSAGELKNSTTSPTPPQKHWTLKLAWSEYKSGAWSTRRILSENIMDVKIYTESFDWEFDRIIVENADDFSFALTGGDGGVTITALYSIFDFDLQRSSITPFVTLLFDGWQIIKLDGTYSVLAFNEYQFQSNPVNGYNFPVADRTPGKLERHSFMVMKEFLFGNTQRITDTEFTDSFVIFDSSSLNMVFLYPAQTPRAVFSAPRSYSISTTINDTWTIPFVATNWGHQFFLFPVRQIELTFIWLDGYPVPILLNREVRKIDFSVLDWIQASRLRMTLARQGVSALISFDSQDSLQNPPVQYFDEYKVPADLPVNRPNGDIEFLSTGATSIYNFELFFYAPFAIACALNKNQRFEEAQQWFHYIFDPTDAKEGTSPDHYWQFRPFRESVGISIEDLIARLADVSDQSTEKRDFQALIAQWKADPFKPHIVARMRLRSYMYAVVMKYLDNLLDWADQLFRRDTMESLNEATQLYILASQILGRRPERLPHRTRPKIQSYIDLASAQPDDLTNALVDAENLLPGANAGSGSISGNGLQSLYFCVPNNPKIDAYYDRVEGQLYKLRNCMNIDGVVRELALFAPEIDPGLLVKAAAAGIDLSTALSDSQGPLPLYRFEVMSRKAAELCAEVKALGAALLNSIEKADGEAMARLRSGHELSLMRAVRQVKETQLQEAKSSLDAVAHQISAAQGRFKHYVGLVSQLEPMSIPAGPVSGPTLQELAISALETISAVTDFAAKIVTPFASVSLVAMNQLLTRAADALKDSLPAENMATSKVPMNASEKAQLAEMKSAHDLQSKAASQRLVAQAMAMLPDITLGTQGMSSPVIQAQLGGTLFSKVANFQASQSDDKASEHSYRASLYSMLGGYQRRADDWLLQAQLASFEIAQLGELAKAGTLRIAIAAQELRNHDKQAANAQEADEFMRSKFSNQELYNWMSGQLSGLYFQMYRMAYDLAKRAERCFNHELGTQASFIQFGYWDGLRKGLLAGDALYADLKRMEVAYTAQNVREFEIIKHVSLLQLDPMALVRLRETGECEFAVPEVLFDLDYPGHYFRRIKSASISVPCVAGPYTSLSSTLTLLSSSIRTLSMPANQNYSDSSNFRQSTLPTQSIATSTGQNDSGIFELNFRDERYLPFEGAGAISNWRLCMPEKFRAFDYSTISDVVLHVKYTARDGGGLLRRAAQDAMIDTVNAIALRNSGLNRLFSLKQDFPSEWSRFAKAASTNDPRSQEFSISLRYFPFLFANSSENLSIGTLSLFIVPSSKAIKPVNVPSTLALFQPSNSKKLPPTGDVSIGHLLGKTYSFDAISIAADENISKWTLQMSAEDAAKFHADVDDLLLVMNYTLVKS
ncbi:MAG: neuraminidase-like domain-containing protein [Leptothrix sp. (in: b-proteobacteria)]